MSEQKTIIDKGLAINIPYAGGIHIVVDIVDGPEGPEAIMKHFSRFKEHKETVDRVSTIFNGGTLSSMTQISHAKVNESFEAEALRIEKEIKKHQDTIKQLEEKTPGNDYRGIGLYG